MWQKKCGAVTEILFPYYMTHPIILPFFAVDRERERER